MEDLVAESKHIITSMQDLRVEIKNEQLPITALVRSPLLAIRYNLSNGKVSSTCYQIIIVWLTELQDSQNPAQVHVWFGF